MIRKWLSILASLRLTVGLFALAMILIFLGTIAQTEVGVWQAVDRYFRSWIAPLGPGWAGAGDTQTWFIPFPGGRTIGAAMIVNLLAAHAVRFRATKRRIGILVLHAGLIVLLAGEFVTGFLAEEGLMAIDEGSSSSIVEDVRRVELALIDPTDPERDRVITIPGRLLADAAAGESIISDARIPFGIRVDQWMPNAALFHVHVETPATHGIGLEARAEPRPRVSGVEGAQADTPAAYVTLVSSQGQAFGTWMVSAALAQPQRVDLGESAWGLSLRYRRTYLPFDLHLEDFSHDTFTGTTIAKNFSSDLRLIDPASSTDRPVRIWMNNPLRYGGLTFYQASYKPDGSGTVLQVVSNPGWLMPYAACVLVGGGMVWQFVQSLSGFLRRRGRSGQPRPEPGGAPARTKSVAFGLAIGACGIMIACSALFRPVPVSEYNLDLFGALPVTSGGRIKPMDTAARSMLMAAGGRQSVAGEGGAMTATGYLLALAADPTSIADLPVVRVDDPDVLALLGMAPDDAGRLGLAVIEPHWATIAEQAESAAAVPPRERDRFQRAVLDLHDRVNTILAHAQMREPYTIPPTSPRGEWRPFYDAFLDDRDSQTPHPSVAYLATMMASASDEDADAFNRAVASYTDLLKKSMPGVMRRGRIEVLFNRASLFQGAAVVYLLSFVTVCLSFAMRSRASPGVGADRIRGAASALLLAAILVHSVAILLRMYLQGRPPVTNLYSSAVFVGWAAAVVGVLLERVYPYGLAILGSTVIGFSTLVVAHNLGNDGDTMQMMQAVLDSNFWLATHVVTITLGYSATFLAGGLGAIHLIGRGITGISTDQDRALGRMVYGVVCFALLLSFVGTVLGGVWADQSWGRFWGWDPKENGAALIVFMNAAILHARWGGMIRTRGVAVLAIAGNIVTAWSWFGTNMLGVGLHAYGFMDSAGRWLWAFIATQIALMLLAILPARSRSKADPGPGCTTP